MVEFRVVLVWLFGNNEVISNNRSTTFQHLKLASGSNHAELRVGD